MSWTMPDLSLPVDINIGSHPIQAMSFSTHGDYLVCGGDDGLWIWRVEDTKQVASMAESVEYVQCLAVSPDGRWIATGTYSGNFIVWDTDSYGMLFAHKECVSDIRGVDFSPDSKRLVTASLNGTVSVWDITTRERVLGPIRHDSWATAAKYSPHGDRIVTATNDRHSVRVYDSSDGHLLGDIPVKVTPWYNTGLVWSKEHLLCLSGSEVKEVQASTGSAVSDWLAPDNDRFSCILLSRDGEFIAYSAHRTVTFWDASTHATLGFIQHAQDIRSIALSPDDRFLAIGGDRGKITINYLRDVLPPSYFIVPFIDIPRTVLDLWKRDQLADAEALLTEIIGNAGDRDHHAHANRSLVRAHLGHWDIASDDARKSIEIRPSVAGYVAQSMALIGQGKQVEGCLILDFAFRHCHPNGVDLLLLIKAILLFTAGQHENALMLIDALIATVHSNPVYYIVKAYIYLRIGEAHSTKNDHEVAIRLFERARAEWRDYTSRELVLVSLISRWNLDKIDITIQRRLCEALYAAGRTEEAGDGVLQVVRSLGKEGYGSETIADWVSDFTQRCLIAPEAGGDAHSAAARTKHIPLLRSMSNSLTPSLLLIEWARAKLAISSWKDALTSTVGFMAPKLTIYRVLCEHLEMIDRTTDAAECFHRMASELEEEINFYDEQQRWARDFRQRCSGKLENIGDVATRQQQHDVAIAHYSAALSLYPANQRDLFMKRSKARITVSLWKEALNDAKQVLEFDSSSIPNYEEILIEWTKVNLKNGLWKDVLSATYASGFDIPKLTVYRTLCESLERVEGIADAIDCFHTMASELPEETVSRGEQAEWFHDFRYRCSKKMARIGDAAMDSQQRDEATGYYSAALSIHPINTSGFFILRSKLWMAKKSWEDAIDEAEQAIVLDPTSPWGYEIKRAALHYAGRFEDAINTFETMLSKMAHSADPTIRQRRDQYVHPSSIRALIRKVVQRTIRHSPRVLVNTTTGRLQNKAEQSATFMSYPIVNELVSSMTTRIDRGRIKHEVKQFFRYVMLSHRWEENEPLFQQVVHTAVYDLDSSPTHDKLQIFCRITRDFGFNWAWSDTCCINKDDHFVLQEALVAMFRWYRRSSLMIVFLRGVRSTAELGELVRSIWNTRAWTLQEYVAAKVIRFYTEDWTPYLNLDTLNHKDSPEIISEMEEVTRISAYQLMALRPGLGSIREKLCLASTRQTTLVEDVAYSLLGIFSVSGMSAIYGEGENALGRLLAHILAGSGDTSILAWSGQSGGYNSCLPARITVFGRSAPSCLPPHIEDTEMEKVVRTLLVSYLDIDSAMILYDRLNELPAPWFAASRMKLPCIAFKLPPLISSRSSSWRVYRVESRIFGTVEIKTRQDLSRLNTLYLVHPWLDSLLDREHATVQSSMFVEDDVEEPSSPMMTMDNDMSGEDFAVGGPYSSSALDDDEDLSDGAVEDDSLPFPEADSPHPTVPKDTVPMDRETRALRLVARLRLPFGALLLALTSTRRRAVAYKRVAADGMITVRLKENVSLTDLLENVRVLDVL